MRTDETKKGSRKGCPLCMAGSKGFEPSKRFPVYALSRRTPSADSANSPIVMAEREGFEPPRRFPACSLSRRVLSAGLSHLSVQ